MKIEWKKVTTLSQVVAIVLFVSVFFAGFIIGRKFENKLILGRLVATATFICDGKKEIWADFYAREVRLKLTGFKAVTYLPQTISGSGARYANTDESFVFWNKGNTAFVEQNGQLTFVNCLASIK